MSRLNYTAKNIFTGYISNLVSTILGFVSRTFFIQILGVTYLGVNGLFTNVLGMLSFAELGIGVAMNHSLYKPVAENDTKKIKSLMSLYKKAYRVIALVVLFIGIGIMPFLNYVIKDPGDIGNIYIYYSIFLFNTVISYFVSYKFSLVNAEQKNYIFNIITTATAVVTIAAQLVSLFIFRSFLIYLLTASFIGLLQKIFISIYLNRKYPYLLEKAEALSAEELRPIKKNVAALVWHKIGEISIHQTDNIIISAFLSITIVGIISNYNLLITSVSAFVNIIFNSVIGSLGNLLATADVKKQYEIFKIYRFVAFWIYGFCAIAFYMLLTPFITLWLGSDMQVADTVILCIVLNYYMLGDRIVINNIKSAGGVFVQDKFVALGQAVINIAVSTVFVQLIGLAGVFLGTLVAGLLPSIVKPIVTYKAIFKIKSAKYFIDAIKYITAVAIPGTACLLLKNFVLRDITLINFLMLLAAVIMIPNLFFYCVFRRSDEFVYLKNIALSSLRRRRKTNG